MCIDHGGGGNEVGKTRQRRTGRKKMGCVCGGGAHTHTVFPVEGGCRIGRAKPYRQVQMGGGGPAGSEQCQKGLQVGQIWVGGAGGTYKGRVGGRS